MRKIISRSLPIAAFIFSFTFFGSVLATSGACSGHGGVNCSVGADSDGSVICNDGWLNSSVFYSNMKECASASLPATSTSTPTTTTSTTVTTSTSATPEDTDTSTDTSLSTTANLSATDNSENTSFSDVTSTNQYSDAIKFVKANNIVSGYSDGTFKPSNKINRAEFTKILIGATFPHADPSSLSCFKDVSASDWFASPVCIAKDLGVIEGYSDGTFRPENSITVAEALKITLEASKKPLPESNGAWYQKYMDYAASNNISIAGWSDPTYQITRQEMAELIYLIKN